MYNPKSKKLAPLRILQVLYKHSSSNNPLFQEDIADYLQKDYDMQLERKAISRNLNFLRDAGFFIESIPQRGYFFARAFNDEEVYLLADAVLSSERIEIEHAKELVKKISKLGSDKFDFRVSNVNCVGERSEEGASALFETITEINWEITRKLQIKFEYLRAGADGKTVKKSCSVIPRQLIIYNHTYYLLAYNGENLVFYDLKNIGKIYWIQDEKKRILDSGRDEEVERLAIAAFIKEI